MSDAIRRNKVIHGLLLLCLGYQSGYLPAGTIGQKNGTGLGIAGIYVADSVQLLFFPCILMLF